MTSLIQPHIEDYQDMLQYIGNNEEEYFLILDSANKRKYVLSLPTHTLTRNQTTIQKMTCFPFSMASSTSNSSLTLPQKHYLKRPNASAAN